MRSRATAPPVARPAGTNDDTGQAWAAQLQQQHGGLLLVLWEVAGRHLTGFYKGPSPVGIYVKASNPQELLRAVNERIGELRLEPWLMLRDTLPGHHGRSPRC
ncbi:hypothetical protein [Nonomuraea gerenzanensis]|uniref:hypothetical protein n=1 Tax=Nonomuraea gerenzanensis TaxID=93944 RepID=UPI001CD96AC5|nr:hypothetical protein [Nonomuraea gerenzanensis]UBU16448.1 hypothetical protein LCN96_15960 [Nonomuraea gerenzanensis]